MVGDAGDMQLLDDETDASNLFLKSLDFAREDLAIVKQHKVNSLCMKSFVLRRHLSFDD